MKAARPDIPKKLASRVRAAHRKVEQERYSVIGTEQSIAGDQAKIEEFEADPEAFACRHYGNHDVDSYPVPTTIARSRERMDYNIRRQPVRIKRLVEAERDLIAVEEEVLHNVKAMPATKGRVSWPKPLPTMTQFRELKADADRRWEEQRRREEQAWTVRQAAEDEQRQAEREHQNRLEIAEFHRQSSLLPPEDQARQREASDKIMALVESGKLSKADLFNAVMKYLGSQKK